MPDWPVEETCLDGEREAGGGTQGRRGLLTTQQIVSAIGPLGPATGSASEGRERREEEVAAQLGV